MYDNYEATTAPTDNSGSALTKAILSLVFSETFFLSFLGIIFGALGIGQCNKIAAECGTLTGKAKVAKILSVVGLVLSIVMTAIVALYVFVIIIFFMNRTVIY